METTPVLPKFYWDVESLEQRYLKICEEITKIHGYLPELESQVILNRENIKKLTSELEEYLKGGFEDFYKEQIERWVNENVGLIFAKFAKSVFFGLTSDGYFCAYIPSSWSDIQFDTGMIYGTENYGRLILRWDTMGQGVINNTKEVVYVDSGGTPENSEQILEELNSLKNLVLYNRRVLTEPLNRKV